MKFNYKSKKGFTLIELLVVIGILAVLAAIAIPSVAGLIDRANVSSDNTNANEYTNAVERFASEYELYCQDIASGVIKDENGDGKPDGDLDSAQGRVYNVTGAVSRADITALESSGHGDKQINRDTKYPLNTKTLEAIIVNYTKTSSATFEPKQSDCSYWYNPDCGIVVVAKTNASYADLNKLVVSGMDAKGNSLESNENWNNITNESQNPTEIKKYNVNITYLGGDHHREGYVFYSIDGGNTWIDIMNIVGDAELYTYTQATIQCTQIAFDIKYQNSAGLGFQSDAHNVDIFNMSNITTENLVLTEDIEVRITLSHGGGGN